MNNAIYSILASNPSEGFTKYFFAPFEIINYIYTDGLLLDGVSMLQLLFSKYTTYYCLISQGFILKQISISFVY